MAGFNCISLKLKEMYQMITMGGDAELELVDSLDPFSEVRRYVMLLLPSKHMGACLLLQAFSERIASIIPEHKLFAISSHVLKKS